MSEVTANYFEYVKALQTFKRGYVVTSREISQLLESSQASEKTKRKSLEVFVNSEISIVLGALEDNTWWSLLDTAQKRLFGISHGQGVGLPNLLGVSRKKPEQVRESDMSAMQTPRDPQKIKHKWAFDDNDSNSETKSHLFEGRGTAEKQEILYILRRALFFMERVEFLLALLKKYEPELTAHIYEIYKAPDIN